MAADVFAQIADAYEAMIDWPKRLAHEEPFYRWLFERVVARRVLDTACGAGHHAAMFASWGLQVEAADISPAMLERAMTRFGEPDGLRWDVRGFHQRVEPPGSFDVAICVGNSLALAPDQETMARAIAAMLGAVRRGGAILIHVMNLWRLPEGQSNWQKCRCADINGSPSLIIKGVRRSRNLGYVDLLIANLADAEPSLRSECVQFLGLEDAQIEQMARDAGAKWVEAYGGYQREPYRREKSQDLIIVAGY